MAVCSGDVLIMLGENTSIMQVLQIATTVLGTIGALIGIILGYMLHSLRELRNDIKHAHDQFEAFVRNDNCKMHREMIENHIADSEARIEKILSHCKDHKANNG